MTKISRLPQEVVNRIAAGEVVVRPANAVKELIENSLDACSTEISVSIKDGGIGSIQIQDNGKGIHKDDMEIVCERFTTSKLAKFEDLQNMQTFGFRGEALSSVSHVSRVTITTKPEDQVCAYQGTYKDGKLCEPVRASAGLNGTTIVAQDLFYNCPSRKTAFKNVTEESSRVCDVVTRYAVHRPDVAFAMRRGGGCGDFRTTGNGDRKDAIGVLIGKEMAKTLQEISIADRQLHYTINGLFAKPISACTSTAIQSRKARSKTLFLFINHRSVQCTPLKHALDTVFQLRDVISPFLYLDLQIDPGRIDVNVHPTKESVMFLEQDAIIESIQSHLESQLFALLESQVEQRSVARDMAAQRLMHDYVPSIPQADRSMDSESGSVEGEKTRRDHDTIRTCAKDRRLDEFLFHSKNCDASSQVELMQVPCTQTDRFRYEQIGTQTKRIFFFDSLETLKKRVVEGASKSLRLMFKDHCFVGCVSVEQVLIQFSTSLYLIDLRALLQEMFYQTILFSFGNLGSFQLGSEGAFVEELYLLARSEESMGRAKEVCEFLQSHAEMLNDYFSICFEMVESEGISRLSLTSIPSLLAGFVPQMEALPQFVAELVEKVDWEEELPCFEGIARCVSTLFTPLEKYCNEEMLSGMGDAQWKRVVQDIIMPRIKSKLIPREEWKESDVIMPLAHLHDLYKIFERC